MELQVNPFYLIHGIKYYNRDQFEKTLNSISKEQKLRTVFSREYSMRFTSKGSNIVDDHQSAIAKILIKQIYPGGTDSPSDMNFLYFSSRKIHPSKITANYNTFLEIPFYPEEIQELVPDFSPFYFYPIDRSSGVALISKGFGKLRDIASKFPYYSDADITFVNSPFIVFSNTSQKVETCDFKQTIPPDFSIVITPFDISLPFESNIRTRNQ